MGYSVPNPSTGKEDATIPLSIQETSPMNIHIKIEIFWTKTCIHYYYTAEAKPYIQAFSMLIVIQYQMKLQGFKHKNTYLMKKNAPQPSMSLQRSTQP